MGKNKHTSPDERKIIWNLFNKEKQISKVVQILGFSRGKVVNAIAYYKKNSTFQNCLRNKPRKTTAQDDRKIVRLILS